MEALSKNKIKWIRSLGQKKNRDKENLFIVEGEKMVLELIDQWPSLIQLICGVERPTAWDGEFYSADSKVLKEISNLKTPNKLLAVVEKPTVSPSNSQLILVIDGVQDPGNMGTILRTADWFGVDHVICSKNSVDIFNAKVIQSSMGSLFRTKVEYLNLVDYLNSTSKLVYGALLDGENMYQGETKREGILVVGNEGNGISDEVRTLITNPLLIPQYGNAESLNVAIATGVLLAEFTRP